MGDRKDSEIEYYVIKQLGNSEDISYSVICIRKINGEILLSADVSSNKKKAESFCDFLNRNSISLIHFYDVLEDYFYC